MWSRDLKYVKLENISDGKKIQFHYGTERPHVTLLGNIRNYCTSSNPDYVSHAGRSQDAHRLSWAARGMPTDCPWAVRGQSTGCKRPVRGLPVGCPWAARGMPVRGAVFGLPNCRPRGVVQGMPVGCLSMWAARGLYLPWDAHGHSSKSAIMSIIEKSGTL